MTLDRITVVPGLCGGRPTLRGMRITVADVLELLAGGMSQGEILEDYPFLEADEITACLRFAARQARYDVGMEPSFEEMTPAERVLHVQSSGSASLRSPRASRSARRSDGSFAVA